MTIFAVAAWSNVSHAEHTRKDGAIEMVTIVFYGLFKVIEIGSAEGRYVMTS